LLRAFGKRAGSLLKLKVLGAEARKGWMIVEVCSIWVGAKTFWFDAAGTY
jgi:hypothetical protein